MLYFTPARAFVGCTVKSQVACENDLWVSGIHCEHLEADVPVRVIAAISLGKASRWDLDPSHAAVQRTCKGCGPGLRVPER